MILLSFLACTPPDGPTDKDRRRRPDDTDLVSDDTDPQTTGSTGETAATGDTAPPGPDCTKLVAAADITWTFTSEIVTEEDFDFDGQGYLLTQRSSALQGIDREGVSHFVSANSGGDATGIRSTADGFVVVAQPWAGSIWRINPLTGASTTLLGGLDNPNGIEAGEDGMAYVAENSGNGRIRMVNPVDGTFEVLTEAAYPNGLVLSPDDQTLYFTTSPSPFGGHTRIVAMSRGPDGLWDPSTREEVYVHPAYVGSVTMDACGNLYGLEYSGGRVFRLDTATREVEMIAEFTRGGSFSALHFSPGLGGWDVNSLYVTSRHDLYEIPTGVPGSHVLTP